MYSVYAAYITPHLALRRSTNTTDGARGPNADMTQLQHLNSTQHSCTQLREPAECSIYSELSRCKAGRDPGTHASTRQHTQRRVVKFGAVGLSETVADEVGKLPAAATMPNTSLLINSGRTCHAYKKANKKKHCDKQESNVTKRSILRSHITNYAAEHTNFIKQNFAATTKTAQFVSRHSAISVRALH